MYTKPETPWWEIEGLKGEDWFPLYHAKDRDEGRVFLNHVLRNDEAPEHAAYEDFRLAPPTHPRNARQEAEEKARWMSMDGQSRRPRRRATA